MTDHPLTKTAAAELWDTHAADTVPWDDWHTVSRRALTAMLRAVFDAGREHERTNPEDDRPWEPLNGPVRVGDEVRRELNGITTIAVVGDVDADGDPWTAEGGLIGLLKVGTWYVRRAVQDVPTEPGEVIVNNDGHEYITATFGGEVYRAREAILLDPDHWHAAWRSDVGVLPYIISERIDPGTWKVGNR